MSRQQIVILGGGTAGTLTANRLRRRLGAEAQIHVVDRDDRHIYQPGLLFVPFGLTRAERLVRPRRRQLRSGIVFRHDIQALVKASATRSSASCRSPTLISTTCRQSSRAAA